MKLPETVTIEAGELYAVRKRLKSGEMVPMFRTARQRLVLRVRGCEGDRLLADHPDGLAEIERPESARGLDAIFRGVADSISGKDSARTLHDFLEGIK